MFKLGSPRRPLHADLKETQSRPMGMDVVIQLLVPEQKQAGGGNRSDCRFWMKEELWKVNWSRSSAAHVSSISSSRARRSANSRKGHSDSDSVIN